MPHEAFPDPNPDFDDFLAQLHDYQLQSAESTARNEMMTYQISEALAKHGVETVFDANLEVDPEKERDALEELTHEVYEAFAQNDQYISTDEAARYAQRLLITHEIAQTALFTAIKMYIVAYDEYGAEVAGGKKTARKRQLIAEWIVEQGYEIDSNWVRFLNEVLPGDDFSTENADEYLHAAAIKKAKAAKWREKIGPAVEKASESIGKTLTLEEVSSLAIIALISGDSYELQSRVDEAAREAGLTST